MTPAITRGLTRAGLGPVGSLADLVVLAARHGFGAIDTSGAELRPWVEQQGLASVRGVLATHGVQFGCFGLALDWSHGEAEFQGGLATVADDAALAASLGCSRFMTWAMPSSARPPVQHLAITTRRLRLVARLLAGFGLKLGIEYIGPVHLRTHEAHPFLWDLPSTLDWIDAIGEPNVGVVLDTFHWHTSEGTLAELAALAADRIVHVHLNDARPGPASAQRDNDRLFPGQGVIDVVGFLKAVASTGYRGVVAQEVLTPQPLTESPESLAALAAAQFDRLFTAAGLGA